MSYLDRTQSRGTRFGSAAAVLAIETAVGVALVTGLAITDAIAPPVPNPQGVNVEVDLPPPPPVPTPSAAPRDSAITAPQPPFPLPPVPGPAVELPQPVEQGLIPVPTPLPTFAPQPPLPSPSPSFTPRRAVPLNGPTGWIGTDDYPSAELRRGVEGQAGYRLVIASDGKVSACEITASTGSAGLDQATCKYLVRRARFQPATDSQGAKTVGTFTGTVRWQIPK